MPKSLLSRRAFLQTTAAAAGATLASNTIRLDAELSYAGSDQSEPSDRVRFGIVGVGMEGSGLLAPAVSLPGTECVAAADLYDGRHTLAREIVGKPIKTTRRYQELLDDKSIDAIIVAVPDHWHKQVVVDALAARKDVYCEKPMSHNPADGLAMVAAAGKTDRIVQIGAQRTSSVLCAKVKEMIANGAIGDLNLIEATMGRNDPNGAWEYPPPPDLSPQNLDWDTWLGTAPKKPFDPYTFARWRCWKQYGTGVAGDLLVHLISGMMFSLGINEVPKRVSAFGGIYPVEGRPQHARRSRRIVRIHGHSGLHAPEPRLRIGGSHSVPGLEGHDRTARSSPSPIRLRQASILHRVITPADFPAAMRAAYVKKWHEEHDPTPGQEPAPESITINGNDYDDLRPHLWNFFEAVRSRKPVVQDAVFGHNAALACHLANESYFRGVPVRWDEASQTIKSLA